MSQKRFYRSDIFVVIFLAVQILLWHETKKFKPDFSIVPDVPSKESVKAISLGDEQFYFRTLTFQLQNAGDTFGRFTALREYNFVKLYNWFKLLDTLDPKSHFVPSIAAYYFSQTQNTPDVKYVAQYLEEHAEKDLYNKWWWMGQAVYLANHKLKDKDWALRLAYKLSETPRDDVPMWVKQMPAFIHEKRGEKDQAMGIVCNIIKNIDNIEQGEINFMTHFVLERLDEQYQGLPMNEQIANLAKDCPQFERLYENNLSDFEKKPKSEDADKEDDSASN
ncbi:MAG: hypothetical protein COV35_04445 [Alphaproteobacteria bacterium CG11_big_fil_rev_8_21_14_0_20_39_49]|nr:MAG: hypothetical protein COV35_04445 [Alphaproteobacteria bacterium CG11_big_fil_rev_8_21_14_0_20_39_49]